MLAKLLKHEFRATSRIMLPIFCILLLTAIGANISTRLLLEMEHALFNTLGIILMIAFVIAIFGACFASFVVMLQRFYKNLLQDEGYIMMTLPVSVHQLVWSKLLVSIVWYAGTVLCVFLSMFILTFDIHFLGDFAKSWTQIFESLSFHNELITNVPLFILELLILAFASCAGLCLQFYAALAIGHSFANRKMLLSIVVYFAIQFILQFLTGTFFGIMNYTQLDYYLANHLPVLSGITGLHILFVLTIILSCIHAAIFYFITTHFMSKKLNLE